MQNIKVFGENHRVNLRLRDILIKREFLSLALIIIVSIAFGIANPAFFNIINIFDLFKMCVFPGIFACGVMIVLISGGIDMSFLWIGMFAAYSTSKMLSILQINTGFVMPLMIVFLISMLIGAVLGSFNALLVSKFNIPVFIATLSSANIFMGIMFQFVGSEYIFPEQMPQKMIEFSNILLFARQSLDGTKVGLHVSVIIAIVVLVITHLILRYTMTGRSVYAIGGDSSSAERVGINLTKARIFIFMFAGLVAGLAGAVSVSNIQVANPYDFQGRELTVIAAVVIGGTKITGGGGSVIGVALGVLLTNIISQNLVLIGIQPEYNKFVFGILIIFATIVQALQEKYKKR
jgi:simple sugar transport system permease protein